MHNLQEREHELESSQPMCGSKMSILCWEDHYSRDPVQVQSAQRERTRKHRAGKITTAAPRLASQQRSAMPCSLPLAHTHIESILVAAQEQTTSEEILLWMTPSEAPKALQASECSELLDPTRANCWISAQHQPGKFSDCTVALACRLAKLTTKAPGRVK